MMARLEAVQAQAARPQRAHRAALGRRCAAQSSDEAATRLCARLLPWNDGAVERRDGDRWSRRRKGQHRLPVPGGADRARRGHRHDAPRTRRLRRTSRCRSSTRGSPSPGICPGNARADQQGAFRIPNVPPGQYTLVARATIGGAGREGAFLAARRARRSRHPGGRGESAPDGARPGQDRARQPIRCGCGQQPT